MRYIKRPVEVEAVQWTGENAEEILGFTNHYAKVSENTVEIPTLEGTMTAKIGDYIIKGVCDEFYPCKPHIFESTYEKCDDGIDISHKRQYINQKNAAEKRIITGKALKKAVIVSNGEVTRLYLNNKEIKNISELHFTHDGERSTDPKLIYTAMIENFFEK